MDKLRRRDDFDTKLRRNGLARRFALAPFEIAIALLTIWQGVAGLFGLALISNIYSEALPPWLAILTNLLFSVSGMAILLGIFFKSREVEVFGLCVFASIVVARSFVLWTTGGLNIVTVSTIYQSVTVMLATSFRLWVLLSGRVVVLAERPRQSDEGVSAVVGNII